MFSFIIIAVVVVSLCNNENPNEDSDGCYYL